MSKRKTPPPPLPLTPLIDAHTHLDACGATDAESVREIVERAVAAGVGNLVTVADDMAAARFAVAAAGWDERVFAAVALHPTRAGDLTEAAKAELEALAAEPRVVAVGETGLDYYWPGKLETAADPETQREAFAWHIDLAKRLGKPVMIHDREAHEDVLAVLAAEGAPATVIFHCFSGDADFARRAAGAGYVLSFAGPVSFTNNAELHAAARIVPLDQLMVETDAPFLTPHPYRGSPNEPYYLPATARAIAALRGVDPEVIAEASTRTARRVYGI